METSQANWNEGKRKERGERGLKYYASFHKTFSQADPLLVFHHIGRGFGGFATSKDSWHKLQEDPEVTTEPALLVPEHTVSHQLRARATM